MQPLPRRKKFQKNKNKQKNQNPSPQKDKRIKCTVKCTKNKENRLQIKNESRTKSIQNKN